MRAYLYGLTRNQPKPNGDVQAALILIERLIHDGQAAHIEPAMHTLIAASVFGYLYADDDEQLTQWARRILPDAPLAGIAAAYFVKWAHDDTPPDTYYARLLHHCGGANLDFDYALARIGHVMGWGSQRHALRHLSAAKAPYDSIAQTLYCVTQHPDDDAAAIQAASSTQNPAVVALVGGIMGARLGLRPDTQNAALDALAQRVNEAKNAR